VSPADAGEGPREEGFRYPVWRAEWRGGMVIEVGARGHSITVDEPPEFGGTNEGPMPTELLTASLASCLCLAVVWAAGKRRVAVGDVAVEVLPVRAPGEPRYGAYEVVVRAEGDQAELERVVELAERFCWVTNTLKQPPEVRVRVDAT